MEAQIDRVYYARENKSHRASRYAKTFTIPPHRSGLRKYTCTVTYTYKAVNWRSARISGDQLRKILQLRLLCAEKPESNE
jgi:hypothetical protein